MGYRRHPTLFMGMILHAFTHAYGTMLVPLYLLMQRDLGTAGVKPIAAIVSVYGLVYCLVSYGAGILADRFNRKMLLGVGLIGNGIAIMLMGFSAGYVLLILLAVVGGLFGALFHPAANALIPAHYPKNPGMAIGLLGIGSGLGFFAGPQFAGWRAATATPYWGLADWQIPCVEFGLLGIAVGLVFLIIAREVHHDPAIQRGRPLPPGLRRRALAIAGVLGLRDFAGIGTMTLVSLYLQKAHGYDPGRTGWILGAMMLTAVVVNPLAVWLTSGRRRLPGLTLVLLCGAITLTTVPHIPLAWLLPLLALFQVFHLGSYSIAEASVLERISPQIRGRVIGLFLMSAGTFASTSPWIIGAWIDALGARADLRSGYTIPFIVLGLMMALAPIAVRWINRIGEAASPTPAERAQSMAAATVEPIG